MSKSDILVVVKTYPEISKKYTETVCTAGILAETNRMVRLYPIRFRYLEGDRQFRKFQWIKAHIRKSTKDPRPDSYNIESGSIEIGDVVSPRNSWSERYEWLINENTLFPSVEALRMAQKDSGTSLGIIKPEEVKKVIIQERSEKEFRDAINKKNSEVNQLDLFVEKADLYILPVKIMIEFRCQDSQCNGHIMSILDWEFGQLYRKLRQEVGWEEKIKAKIMEEIFSDRRDTHIILGNMAKHPQTFCVLGFFWPPLTRFRQMNLLD